MSYELAKAYIQVIPSTRGIKGSLEKELGGAGKSAGEKAGSGFSSSFGGALKTVGKASAVALVAGVGAMAAFTKSSVEAGMSFDESMSQVAATMGKTMDELTSDIQTVEIAGESWTGNLREYAKKMGAETKFSATEAADALNYMALAGYDTQTSMQMLPNVLNLAAAGGMELARASDMVTDTQSALGLSLEETNAMVDQMARASSRSNTNVEQLGDAMLKIGATARNVAGGTQELSTVLGVLADNGIKGTEGGTHLRNILLSLQQAAENGSVDFGDFSVSVYDADGNMRSMVDIVEDMQTGMGDLSQEAKDAMISGVFNKTDLAAVNALLGTSEERFAELYDAIGDCTGAAQEMAETQLDNLSGDITIMKSAFEGLQIAISDGATPALRESVQGITEVINGLNDLVSGVDGGADRIKAGFSDILSGVKTALPAILEMFSAVMSSVLEMLPEFLDQVVRILPGLFEQIMGTVRTLLPKLAELLPSLVEACMQMLNSLVGEIAKALPELIKQLAVAIVKCIPIIMEGIGSLVKNIALGLLGLEDPIDEANKKLSTIGQAAKDSWAELQGVMNQPVDMSWAGNFSETEQKIDEAEANIKEILQKRYDEQETLRQEDIQNIRKYLDEIEALENEKLNAYEQKAAGRLTIMENMENATLEDYMTQLSMIRQYDAAEKAELEEYYASKMGLAQQTQEQLLADAAEAYTKEKTITYEEYQDLIDAAQDAYDAIAEPAQKYYDDHLATIEAREREATDIITENNSGFIQNLKDTYSGAQEANKNLWDSISGATEASGYEMILAFQEAKDASVDMVNSMDEAAADNTVAWMDLVAQYKAGGGEISGEMEGVTDMILGVFEDMPADMKESGTDTLRGLVAGMEAYIPELSNISNMTAEEIVKVIRDYLGISSPSRVMREIGTNTIAGLTQGIQSTGKNAGSAMYQVGAMLIEGIGRGMQSRGTWLNRIAAQAVRSAVQSAKDAGKIESPSRIMRDEVGLMLSEGLGIGILDGEKTVTGAINELSDSMWKASQGMEIQSRLTAGNMAFAGAARSIGTTMASGQMQIFGERLEGSAAGPTIYITNHIDGADNPEEFASRLCRQIKQEMRMA